MTNHVHLIVKPEQGSNLSRVNGEMRRRYIRMIKLSIVSPKFWAAACNSAAVGPAWRACSPAAGRRAGPGATASGADALWQRQDTALARPEHGLMLRTTLPW